MYVALVSEVERKVRVGAGPEDVGYAMLTLAVNDADVVGSGVMAVELAAVVALEGAACLG